MHKSKKSAHNSHITNVFQKERFKMKVKVIDEKCIQCGLCAELAPDIFELCGDRAAQVKAQPEKDNESLAQTAVNSCPTEAIEII